MKYFIVILENQTEIEIPFSPSISTQNGYLIIPNFEKIPCSQVRTVRARGELDYFERWLIFLILSSSDFKL